MTTYSSNYYATARLVTHLSKLNSFHFVFILLSLQAPSLLFSNLTIIISLSGLDIHHFPFQAHHESLLSSLRAWLCSPTEPELDLCS
jgi:hypothetical protein